MIIDDPFMEKPDELLEYKKVSEKDNAGQSEGSSATSNFGVSGTGVDFNPLFNKNDDWKKAGEALTRQEEQKRNVGEVVNFLNENGKSYGTLDDVWEKMGDQTFVDQMQADYQSVLDQKKADQDATNLRVYNHLKKYGQDVPDTFEQFNANLDNEDYAKSVQGMLDKANSVANEKGMVSNFRKNADSVYNLLQAVGANRFAGMSRDEFDKVTASDADALDALELANVEYEKRKSPDYNMLEDDYAPLFNEMTPTDIYNWANADLKRAQAMGLTGIGYGINKKGENFGDAEKGIRLYKLNTNPKDNRWFYMDAEGQLQEVDFTHQAFNEDGSFTDIGYRMYSASLLSMSSDIEKARLYNADGGVDRLLDGTAKMNEEAGKEKLAELMLPKGVDEETKAAWYNMYQNVKVAEEIAVQNNLIFDNEDFAEKYAEWKKEQDQQEAQEVNDRMRPGGTLKDVEGGVLDIRSKGKYWDSFIDKVMLQYHDIAQRRGLELTPEQDTELRAMVMQQIAAQETTEGYVNRLVKGDDVLSNILRPVFSTAVRFANGTLEKTMIGKFIENNVGSYKGNDALIASCTKAINEANDGFLLSTIESAAAFWVDLEACNLPIKGFQLVGAGANNILNRAMTSLFMAKKISPMVKTASQLGKSKWFWNAANKALMGSNGTYRFINSGLNAAIGGASTFYGLDFWHGLLDYQGALDTSELTPEQVSRAMYLQKAILGDDSEGLNDFWGVRKKDGNWYERAGQALSYANEKGLEGAEMGAYFSLGGAVKSLSPFMGTKARVWAGTGAGLLTNSAVITAKNAYEQKDKNAGKILEDYFKNVISFSIYELGGWKKQYDNMDAILASHRAMTINKEHEEYLNNLGVSADPAKFLQALMEGKLEMKAYKPAKGSKVNFGKFDKDGKPLPLTEQQKTMNEQANKFFSNALIPEAIRRNLYTITTGMAWMPSAVETVGEVRKCKFGDKPFAVDVKDREGNIIDTFYYKTESEAKLDKTNLERQKGVEDLPYLSNSYTLTAVTLGMKKNLQGEYDKACKRRKNGDELTEREKDVISFFEDKALLATGKMKASTNEALTEEEQRATDSMNRLFEQELRDSKVSEELISAFEKENDLEEGELKKILRGYEDEKLAKKASESGEVVTMESWNPSTKMLEKRYYTLEDMQLLRDYRESIFKASDKLVKDYSDEYDEQLAEGKKAAEAQKAADDNTYVPFDLREGRKVTLGGEEYTVESFRENGAFTDLEGNEVAADGYVVLSTTDKEGKAQNYRVKLSKYKELYFTEQIDKQNAQKRAAVASGNVQMYKEAGFDKQAAEEYFGLNFGISARDMEKECLRISFDPYESAEKKQMALRYLNGVSVQKGVSDRGRRYADILEANTMMQFAGKVYKGESKEVTDVNGNKVAVGKDTIIEVESLGNTYYVVEGKVDGMVHLVDEQGNLIKEGSVAKAFDFNQLKVTGVTTLTEGRNSARREGFRRATVDLTPKISVGDTILVDEKGTSGKVVRIYNVLDGEGNATGERAIEFVNSKGKLDSIKYDEAEHIGNKAERLVYEEKWKNENPLNEADYEKVDTATEQGKKLELKMDGEDISMDNQPEMVYDILGTKSVDIMAEANITAAEKRLEEINNGKVEGKNDAERLKSMQANQAEAEKLQQKIDFWNKVKNVGKQRVDEQKKAEAQAIVNSATEREMQKATGEYGAVDDTTLKLVGNAPDVMELAETIGKKIGRQIIFRDQNKWNNGKNDFDNEKIYVYLDANDITGGKANSLDKVIKAVLGHEVTHSLLRDNAELRDSMQKLIVDYMGKSAFEEERQRKLELYVGSKDKDGNPIVYTEKQIRDAEEEILCDWGGRLLLDPDYVQRLISGKELTPTEKSWLDDHSKIKAIVDFVRELWRNTFGSPEEEQKIVNPYLSELQKLYAKAIDMSAREVSISNTAETGKAIGDIVSGSDVDIVVRDNEGNMVIQKKDGRISLSAKAYKGEDPNVPNTRDLVVRYASAHGGFDIVEQMDKMVEMSDRMLADDEYKTYAKWANTAVVLDANGNPAFSIVKKNGEYPLNIDASTNCKKREETNAVLNDLIKEGLIGKDGLSEEDIIALKKIITKHGLEIACDICFVDERRYHAGSQGKTVAGDHNAVIEKYLLKGTKFTLDDLDHFNFAGDETIEKKDFDVEQLNWKALEKIAPKVKSTTRMGVIVNGLLSNHSFAKVADWTDFIATEGKIGERKAGAEGEYMNSVFNKIGASIMKRSEPQADNLHQILTDRSKGTGSSFTYIPKTIARDADGNMVWVDAEGGKEMFGDTDEARRDVYRIAGVRLQSFSDAQAWYWFDDAETICDLALKQLPAHKYTKELWNVKAFGKTGVKHNMSAVARIKQGVYAKDNRFGKKGDPIAPGLDENGNLLWADYYVYDGDKIVGSIQSINVAESVALHHTKGYSADCGVIAVGASDEQIISLQESDDYSMVIGFHSNLSGDVKYKTGLEGSKNYVKCQHERSFTSEEEKQNWLNGTINSTEHEVGKNFAKGNPQPQALKDFNFYDALSKYHEMAKNGEVSMKDVPDLAAKEYLDMCWDNGFLPEFDQFAWLREEDWHGIKNFRGKLLMGEDGRPLMRKNYFKHVTDYCLIDGITGEYAPQRAVEFNFPKEEDAFGSFESIIKDAVKYFDDIELKRDSAHEMIKQEYREQVFMKNEMLKEIAKEGYAALKRGEKLSEEQKAAISKVEGVSLDEVNKMQTNALGKIKRSIKTDNGDILNELEDGGAELIAPDGTKYSIKTWHGTAADFKEFDHSFMGSGEGAQVFGWGTYVSGRHGIAKAYAETAKTNAERRNKNVSISFNGKKFRSGDSLISFSTENGLTPAMQVVLRHASEYSPRLYVDGIFSYIEHKIKNSYSAKESELEQYKDAFRNDEVPNDKEQEYQDEIDFIEGLLREYKDGLAELELVMKGKSNLEIKEPTRSHVEKSGEVITKDYYNSFGYNNGLKEIRNGDKKALDSLISFFIENNDGDIEETINDLNRLSGNGNANQDVHLMMYNELVDNRDAWSYIKPDPVVRHLYEVEIPDDKTDNYLSWDETYTEDQYDKIAERISNACYELSKKDSGWNGSKPDLGRVKEAIKNDALLGKVSLNSLFRSRNLKKTRESVSGGRIYTGLVNILGSDKYASLLLSEAGFTGIKVSTGYAHRGQTHEAKNYVIFKEGDAKIVNYDSHEKWSKKVAPEQDEEYMRAVKGGSTYVAQKMVDDVAERAGYTIEGYHGTTNKFYVFDKNKANAEGNWGKGFYFTDSRDDVEENYANNDGADLTVRIEQLAEHMEWMDGYEDMDYDARLEEARKQLSEGDPRTIEAYLKMDNPVKIGGADETFFDLEYKVDEDGEYDYDYEPEGKLMDFYNALSDIVNESDWNRIELYELLEYGDGGLTASQLEDKAREILNKGGYQDYEGNMATGEAIREAFERMGFDGIVDNRVSQKFRGMNGLYGDTTHMIAFKPEQIKLADAITYDNDGNVIPLSERFNEGKEDIRYSKKVEPSKDFSEIGEIVFESNFDEDEYKEWLVDNEYDTDTEEHRKEYWEENVEFEMEYLDNETYHPFEGESFYDYADMEAELGTNIANEILDTCMKKGKGRLEPILYISNEDIDIHNPEELNAEVKKLLPTGEYTKNGRGFILSDGTMVYTNAEHNMITSVPGIDDKFQFIKLGNIRVLDHSVDIGGKPTEEQKAVLRKIIGGYSDEYLYLDIMGEHGEVGCQYNSPTYSRVMADINRFYDEGIKPEGDMMFSKKGNEESKRARMGSYFTGAGLLEEGLKGIIDPKFGVEYDEKIAGVYRDNFGNHIVTADVTSVDLDKIIANIDGPVEYFHASPVCKRASKANNNGGEIELDVETAKATAEAIHKINPMVFTLENVPDYKNFEAMAIIQKALKDEGYTVDTAVYDAKDFGAPMSRKRLIIRAVKDGNLPLILNEENAKGWFDSVKDIVDSLPDANDIASWQKERFAKEGMDWQNTDKPIIVYGNGAKSGKNLWAYGDAVAPSMTTKSGSGARIILPGGVIKEATPRVFARLFGMADEYQLPENKSLAYTIIGNGIPTQLTEGVIAPLVDGYINKGERYSMKGPKGAQTLDNQDGGNRIKNLEIAERMLNGKDWNKLKRDEKLKIKYATGWEMGADGQWRHESVGLKWKPDAFTKTWGKKVKLSDLLEGSELFKAYPELDDIKITRTRQGNIFGVFYAETNELKVNTALLSKYNKSIEFNKEKLADAEKGIISNWIKENFESEFGKPLTNENVIEHYRGVINDYEKAIKDEIDSLQDTINHEVQHAIQRKEGFAVGGSNTLDRYVINNAEPVLRDFTTLLGGNDPNKLLRMGYSSVMSALRSWKINSKTTQANKDRIDNILTNVTGDQFEQLVRDFAKLYKEAKASAPKTYPKLAGEVEANAAGKRSFMTPEELATTLIEDSESIARDEQIIRFSRKKDEFEDAIREASKQNYGSAGTSINGNKLPAGFSLVDKVGGFKEGTTNLDMGGGKFDNATEMLSGKGVTNMVFDPFNRDAEHNKKVADVAKNEGFDTVTCNNCLNVINAKGARSNVILQCAKALKDGGTAYFTVYEGNGSGEGKVTQNGNSWQENRKTADYLDEVREHFDDVKLKGKLIIAKNPKQTDELSYWAYNGFDETEGSTKFSKKGENDIIAYAKNRLSSVGSDVEKRQEELKNRIEGVDSEKFAVNLRRINAIATDGKYNKDHIYGLDEYENYLKNRIEAEEDAQGLSSGSGNPGVVEDLKQKFNLIQAEKQRRADKFKELASEYHIGKDGSISLADAERLYYDLVGKGGLPNLFEATKNAIEKFGIPMHIKTIKPDRRGEYKADFAIGGGEINYQADVLLMDGAGWKKGKTILHEMIHSATTNLLKDYIGDSMPSVSTANKLAHVVGLRRRFMNSEDRTFAAELINIYDQLSKREGLDRHGERFYGLKNVKELIAELANPEFRMWLSKQHLEGDVKTTALGRIKNWIRRWLLGYKDANVTGNALAELSSRLDTQLNKLYRENEVISVDTEIKPFDENNVVFSKKQFDAPNTPQEWVAFNFRTLSPESVMREAGMKPADLAGLRHYVNKKGIDLVKAAEDLYFSMPDEFRAMTDDAEVRDWLIDMCLSGGPKKFIAESQAAYSENERAEYERQRNLFYEDTYHMSYDEYMDYLDSIKRKHWRTTESSREQNDAQKEVANAIQAMMHDEYLTAADKSEINRLLALVKNATPNNTDWYITEAKSTIADMRMRGQARMITRALNLKTQDVNGRNMSIAKTVDDTTRKVFDIIRNDMKVRNSTELKLQLKSIGSDIYQLQREEARLKTMIARGDWNGETTTELQEELSQVSAKKRVLLDQQKDLKNEIEQLRLDNADELVTDLQGKVDALKQKQDDFFSGIGTFNDDDLAHMTAYELLQRKAEVDAMDTHIANIIDEINKATDERQKQALREMLNTAKNEKASRQECLLNDILSLTDKGRENLLNRKKEEMSTRKMLIEGMFSDIGGEGAAGIKNERVKVGKQYKNWIETRAEEGFWKKWFTAQLGSFEYMAHRIDRNHLSRDGWFYNYFMNGKNGVMAAQNDYLTHQRQNMQLLDAKSTEFFGKTMDKVMKENSKMENESGVHLYEEINDEQGNALYIDKGELPMTKGMGTYLYMVWKMGDGKAKMAKMGFTDESMAQIREFIGEENVNWADWVQGEFLPSLRERYNDKYVDIYGTSMAEIENYVPLKIDQANLNEKNDMNDSQSGASMQPKYGSLINRSYNTMPIDLSKDAYNVILEHLNKMEEFAAFANVRRELDWILNNNNVRNQLDANVAGQYKCLVDAARIAVHATETEKLNGIDKAMRVASKGLVGGNIAFRSTTALKQILSVPAFYGYSQDPLFMAMLTKNIGVQYSANMPSVIANILTFGSLNKKQMRALDSDKGYNYMHTALSGNIKWCVENIPSFRERLVQGNFGIEALNEGMGDNAFGRFVDAYLKQGMSTNKLVDAITCSIGIKTIYDYNMKKATKRINAEMKDFWNNLMDEYDKKVETIRRQREMYPEDAERFADVKTGAELMDEYRKTYNEEKKKRLAEAKRLALMEADIYYNGTQQSNHAAFMSPMQMSKSGVNRMLSVYQNASIGFSRKAAESIENLNRLLGKGMYNKYYQHYLSNGMSDGDAKMHAANMIRNKVQKALTNLAMYGFITNIIWDMGSRGLIGLFQDDDEKDWYKDWTNWISYPFRGQPGMNILPSIIKGQEYSPFLLFNEFGDIKEEVSKLIEKDKGLSPEMASTVVSHASKLTGVNPQVITNTYLAIENLVKEGLIEGEKVYPMIDLMLLLQTPNKNRVSVAKELYGIDAEKYQGMSKAEQNAAVEEYVNAVLFASRAADEESIERYVPGMKVITKSKQVEIINECLKGIRDIPSMLKSDEAKEMYKYVEDVNELAKAYDNATGKAERDVILTQLKKVLGEEEFGDMDMQDKIERQRKTLGTGVKETQDVKPYEVECNAQDQIDDYKISIVKKSLAPIYKTWNKGGADYNSDYYILHKAEIDLYEAISECQSGIAEYKKGINETTLADEKLEYFDEMRQLRKELFKKIEEFKKK